MKVSVACLALLACLALAAAQTNNNNNNGGGANNNNNNNNAGAPTAPGGSSPGWWWFSNYNGQWQWCQPFNCGGSNVGGYWCGCQIYQQAGCSYTGSQPNLAPPQQPPQQPVQSQPIPSGGGGTYIAPGSSQVLQPGTYNLNGRWTVSYSVPTTVSISSDGQSLNTLN